MASIDKNGNISWEQGIGLAIWGRLRDESTDEPLNLAGYTGVARAKRDIDDADAADIITFTVAIETDGPADEVASVTSITRSGSTATVTQTAHGYVTGRRIKLAGSDQSEYNGVKTITKIDANTYTYAVTGTPATPATGTITAVDVSGCYMVTANDAAMDVPRGRLFFDVKLTPASGDSIPGYPTRDLVIEGRAA